jgi:hypothetical protein
MNDTGKSLAAADTGEVYRLLRCWSGEASDHATGWGSLLNWPESVDEPTAQRLLAGLIDGFELYRRDQWLQHASAAATVWACRTGGELERPSYEVVRQASVGANPLRLRREAPFGPAEVSAFLTAFAAAEEAGKLQDRKAALLRGTVLDILLEAFRTARGPSADGDALLDPLHQFHRQHKGDQIRAHALRRLALLDQPPPPGLLACLRQLLQPTEEIEGCLTPAYRLRLFRHLRDMAAPLLTPEDFAAAETAAEVLRTRTDPQATDAAALREVCAPLSALGRFALCVRPVLAGPSAGEHRRWARTLLTNFEHLGELANALLGETPASGPKADASPGATNPAPPEPPRREPSPEEVALAALAATNPAAEEFLALTALAEELLPLVQDCWRDATEALKGLQYPGSRFRQKALRTAQAPAEEQASQIQDAARQLADEFVNKIRRLDALLPGVGPCPAPFKGPAQLSPQTRDMLSQKLKELRDRVFHIMRAYGGYEEYPVVVGESVRRHGPVLDDVTYVSGPRLRPDEIVQILEPGYVRRREDGKQELIRSPKVLVAR